jgi:putative DNA primase/helicase
MASAGVMMPPCLPSTTRGGFVEQQRSKTIKSAKTQRAPRSPLAVVSLARADRSLAATIDQWDRDPWVLNTSGGIINLRTFELRPQQPTDYFTKISPVAPGGACKRWLQFLTEITNEDKALEGFLQRVAGYALTGDTSEHALFFLYGTGANGKSVFLSTLAGVLGDYHRVAPIETFTASTGERHPTDLAMLRGARSVTAIETEEGRRWAESRIKADGGRQDHRSVHASGLL